MLCVGDVLGFEGRAKRLLYERVYVSAIAVCSSIKVASAGRQFMVWDLLILCLFSGDPMRLLFGRIRHRTCSIQQHTSGSSRQAAY